MSQISRLQQSFPKLKESKSRVTSPVDVRYNCLAWAAGVTNVWWEPDSMDIYYWPASVPREWTVDAVKGAFNALGYCETDDEEVESGFEKVAIYGKGNQPTHAARQLSNGSWSSKLGEDVDIEHPLRDLEGPVYGSVVKILRRANS